MGVVMASSAAVAGLKPGRVGGGRSSPDGSSSVGRLLKKAASRAAIAPAAKLGDSQMMFFTNFSLGLIPSARSCGAEPRLAPC
jgi:hypothetical protein